MDERPPPEPAKLLEEWTEWERGDELAGRVMSNLKKGQFHVILDAHGDAELIEVWQRWEKGRVGPVDTLTELQAKGVGDILRQLAAAV
jgi:hypothetical protein